MIKDLKGLNSMSHPNERKKFARLSPSNCSQFQKKNHMMLQPDTILITEFF